MADWGQLIPKDCNPEPKGVFQDLVEQLLSREKAHTQMNQNGKKCSECGVHQPLDNFYKRSEKSGANYGDGHAGVCKLCLRIRAKKRRDEKRLKLIARTRA